MWKEKEEERFWKKEKMARAPKVIFSLNLYRTIWGSLKSAFWLNSPSFISFIFLLLFTLFCSVWNCFGAAFGFRLFKLIFYCILAVFGMHFDAVAWLVVVPLFFHLRLTSSFSFYRWLDCVHFCFTRFDCLVQLRFSLYVGFGLLISVFVGVWKQLKLCCVLSHNVAVHFFSTYLRRNFNLWNCFGCTCYSLWWCLCL